MMTSLPKASAPSGDFSDVLKMNFAQSVAVGRKDCITCRVSCSYGWRDFPINKHLRAIPSSNTRAYSNGLIANELVHAIAILWKHLSADLVGPAGII